MAVRALRAQRAILLTLLLSIGTPMLLGGDELGRTQAGNNNTYCQDNSLAWLDWPHADADLARYTQRLITLRREHAVFRRRVFFPGTCANGDGLPDISWLTPAGRPMTERDWSHPWAHAVAIYLDGDELLAPTARGRGQHSDAFYVCLNAAGQDVVFTLPPKDYSSAWTPVIDADSAEGTPTAADPVPASGTLIVAFFGAVVLSRPSRITTGTNGSPPLLAPS